MPCCMQYAPCRAPAPPPCVAADMLATRLTQCPGSPPQSHANWCNGSAWCEHTCVSHIQWNRPCVSVPDTQPDAYCQVTPTHTTPLTPGQNLTCLFITPKPLPYSDDMSAYSVATTGISIPAPFLEQLHATKAGPVGHPCKDQQHLSLYLRF